MGKIKQKLRDLPVLFTFIMLSIILVLIAMLLVEVEKTVFSNAQREIAFQYSDIVEGFNDKKVWGNQSVFLISQQDSKKMQLYEIFLWILPIITYIACFFVAGLLFYRSKIEKPLLILSASVQRIAHKDLDFSIQYDKKDEMGALCEAFEKMRSALENSNQEIWRQMDERKRLNAAFSHDLRTPLTVMEGHLDILQKYAPEGKLSASDTMETYAVMKGQIDRLKSYVVSMNTLQRLEDIPIARRIIPATDFISQLNDTATIVCAEKHLVFLNQVTIQDIVVDPEIIMQVFENLLSNAVRYATHSVFVKCRSSQNTFSITVSDDGKGFTDAALKSATAPFYSIPFRYLIQSYP